MQVNGCKKWNCWHVSVEFGKLDIAGLKTGLPCLLLVCLCTLSFLEKLFSQTGQDQLMSTHDHSKLNSNWQKEDCFTFIQADYHHNLIVFTTTTILKFHHHNSIVFTTADTTTITLLFSQPPQFCCFYHRHRHHNSIVFTTVTTTILFFHLQHHSSISYTTATATTITELTSSLSNHSGVREQRLFYYTIESQKLHRLKPKTTFDVEVFASSSSISSLPRAEKQVKVMYYFAIISTIYHLKIKCLQHVLYFISQILSLAEEQYVLRKPLQNTELVGLGYWQCSKLFLQVLTASGFESR